jgi:hypothetical protein
LRPAETVADEWGIQTRIELLASEGEIVRLVLGVARAGEADLFGWWRSRGLTEAGEYVLGGALPRTWVLSALEADILSAAARHDEVLGRPTALHLFSDALPAKRWALNWLREHKVEGDPDGLLSQLRAWDRQAARRDLEAWSGVKPAAGELLGQGRRLGTLSGDDLGNAEHVEAALRQLSAAYADDSDEMRFPYFDLAR